MLSVLTTKKIIMITTIKRGGRKLWKVMDMFMALTVGMVSWIYTYLQTQSFIY